MAQLSRFGICSICVVLLVVTCLVAGCTSYQSPASPAAPAPAPAAAGNTIQIKSFAFNPATLTVKTGTTVTWTNEDSVPHTIVTDTGAPVAISSDTLSNGASYQFTFTQPGTYAYHCSIHPSMKGTVVVQG
jgi:amicyanin